MTSTYSTLIYNAGSHIKICILIFLLLFYIIFSSIEGKVSTHNSLKIKSIKNSFFIFQTKKDVTRKKSTINKCKKRNSTDCLNYFALEAQGQFPFDEKNEKINNKNNYEGQPTGSDDNTYIDLSNEVIKESKILFPKIVEEGRDNNDKEQGTEKNEGNGENNIFQSNEQFSDFAEINKDIIQFLQNKGIVHMTKIQSRSFKPIFEGKDMIARSETGTGKTLAFALPLVEKLHHIRSQQIQRETEQIDTTVLQTQGRDRNEKNKTYYEKEKEKLKEEQKEEQKEEILETYNEKKTWEEKQHTPQYPQILVLEPTRELSKQVENTFKEIAQFYNFNILSIYGGSSYTYQEKQLQKGTDIITGTPGRIIDHLEKKNLNLKEIKFVVLDEADEMLNLGFTHDIERILKHIELKYAQILLFSATTPQWVKDLSSKYLKNPIFINVINTNNQTSKTIEHIAIKTPYDIKEKALLLEDIILVKSNGGQTIIFTRTKLEADILSSECSFKSLSFAVLHGNIAQSTREHTMQRFRQNMFQILIATDIAARGLDISNVDLVIQLYPPNYSSIYIHRSGRTGRANKRGISIVLFSEEDKHELIKIEKNCGIKFNLELLPTNEKVFECSSYLAAKKIDTVNKQVVPFFFKTAENLLQRAKEIEMTPKELVARCLALISKKEQIKKRSLLNGLSDTMTLCFFNKIRKWKNESDIIYWINKISNELNVNTFNKILQIKIDTKNKQFSFFDINENMGQLLLQNFNHMSKEEHRKQLSLYVPQKLPEHLDFADQSQRYRYPTSRKKYSYWKTNRNNTGNRY